MTEQEFLERMAKILQVEPPEMIDDLVLENCNWDSLAKISAVVVLDRYARREIPPQDLSRCRTVGDLRTLARPAVAATVATTSMGGEGGGLSLESDQAGDGEACLQGPITLTRLAPPDLEMVRRWRNDPRVANWMAFRDTITPEMHQKWFRSVDNERNYYFVISVGPTKVGVVDLKDIDPIAHTAEVGIYFCHDGKIGGLIPYETMIAMLDFGFDRLGLTNIRAHIVKTNTRSIHFSLSLGSSLDAGQENIDNQSYSLYRDRYAEKSRTMRELIARDNKAPVRFQFGSDAAVSSQTRS